MKNIAWAGVALGTLAVSACGGSDTADINTTPAFVRGAIASAYYDGSSDDLLTAGLGLSGLKAAAPAFANAAAPTVAELRRNTIHTNCCHCSPCYRYSCSPIGRGVRATRRPR